MARVIEGNARNQEPFRAGNEAWYFAAAPAGMVRRALGMAIVDLAPEAKAAERSDAEQVREAMGPLDFMAAVLEACTFTDPDLTNKRFATVEQVWDEVQMPTMIRAGEAALAASRMGGEARATARSFPDPGRDARGVDAAPDREGVRDPADAPAGSSGG